MPSGQADQCKSGSSGTCPGGNGAYCGSSVGKDSKTLYNCINGTFSFKAFCAAGCNVAPSGTADSCKAGSCSSGNGAYCGQSVGLSSTILYHCQNAAYTIQQECSGQCVVAPPGQPDKCP
ncbi:MAG TPA: hypothetical protein EYN66_00790 [Myxococcales bacterium]|nr:hypothetical protein [Myxococcales bacterium]